MANKDAVNEKNQRLDPRSGKMVVYVPPEDLATPPDQREVTLLEKVAGKNPPVQNLRDHDEFAGMDCYVKDVTFTDGEANGKKTDYCIAVCFICPPGAKPKPENFVLLRTGADNVYKRLTAAYVQNALPIKFTLRKGGRAWFAD